MKGIARISVSVVALLCASCAATGLQKFYYLDMRSAKLPVMVSQVEGVPPGRGVIAVAALSISQVQTQGDQRMADGSEYHVTNTITSAEQTRTPLDQQLLAEVKPGDGLIVVHELDWHAHDLFVVFYGSSEKSLTVTATVHPQEVQP